MYVQFPLLTIAEIHPYFKGIRLDKMMTKLLILFIFNMGNDSDRITLL